MCEKKRSCCGLEFLCGLDVSVPILAMPQMVILELFGKFTARPHIQINNIDFLLANIWPFERKLFRMRMLDDVFGGLFCSNYNCPPPPPPSQLASEFYLFAFFPISIHIGRHSCVRRSSFGAILKINIDRVLSGK